MKSLSITWAFYKAAIRSEMQYRLNFVMLTVLGLVYQGSGFAFVWVVLRKFDTIAGWSFGELALLYSMRLLAHAAWVVPFHQIEFLDHTVREGKFDRYLVRPLNPLLQVVTTRFQMNVIGDVVAAVALFSVAAVLTGLDFSALNVLYLLLAVAGGAMAEGAVIMIVSSLSFRFVQTWAANHLVDNIYLMFGSYPTRIFGSALSWAFTWIIPVAFVAYIPSSVLLDKTGELHVQQAVAFGAPLIGALWFAAAYRLWRRQIRGYQSVGN
ncbi:ABC-2 family transporter protein [Streptomyces sp. ATexAB-D23]|uniref:ABC transporter permease n=1 Tax=unclassified Streptomyces TaxID=2593676 RepID=UPI0003718308|nr:ABC-2 family transporter protein [Streptomyces sp. ATexAB-D23]MYY05925.1 ABC transporter permease [Streptomyces sp. SID4913]